MRYLLYLVLATPFLGLLYDRWRTRDARRDAEILDRLRENETANW